MKSIECSIKDVSKADRKVFVDMLTYVSEYIYDVKAAEDYVILKIENENEEEIQGKIEELKGYFELEEIKNRHEVTTKVLEDYRKNEPANKENVFPELLGSKSVVKMCDGVYSYTGLFLSVYRYFSRKIEKFGKENFPGIQEYEESVLYPVDEYERGHYFESFPHHIMFQTTMRNDMDLLNRFSKEGTTNPEIFSNTSMKRPRCVCRHAACVPIYPMLKGQNISEDKPRYFLISGKCFRNEGANATELSRLNEFYMKEYVCVGTFEQTMEMIEKARELWHQWIETFGLNATIETANDSFFASSYKKLKIFQIMGASKQEFRVQIPHNDTYCAVSSSNIHRTHFTKTYNIHNENAICQSACFAFGVDRLAYALLSQKGLDVDKWDAKTKAEIFGE